MKILFRFIEKVLNLIPGWVFGLLSVSIASSSILISFFSFTGYNILFYDVSYLAVGPVGLIFDLGLIFSGIVAIPFHFYMSMIVKDEKINPKLIKFTLSLSIMSSLTLSLIGFFPVLTDNVIILFIHGILALMTFLGVTIYCLFYGLFFLKNEQFSLLHSILSFLVSAIFIFYFTNRWSLIEWISVCSIMIWITFNAVFALLKKM